MPEFPRLASARREGVIRDHASEMLCHLLAGLQCGVLGGVGAVGWLLVTAIWQGRRIWSFPALIASVIRADLVLDREIVFAASIGVAIVLFAGGVTGALFGLAVRDRERSIRIILLAILAGLGHYMLLFWAISRTWGWESVPAAGSPLLMACLIFGLVLGRYPSASHSLRRSFLEEV